MPAIPGSGTAGLPFAAQFGRTIPTNMWDGYLSSNYNSLQVAVNRSFAKGLMLKGAYTYAKAIDYTDDDGWASVGWNWAPVFQRNRAVAGFDRTQNLQMGWLYELPFGKGKMLAKSGAAAAVLGGWQVNGIMSAYTGTPFTVGAPGSLLNAPNNTQTADQVNPAVTRIGQYRAGPTLLRPDGVRLCRPAVRFGSSGRNILRNPGVFNTDLDVTRYFQIKERLQAAVPGASSSTSPNSSHFGGVSTSVTSAHLHADHQRLR